MHKTWRRPLAVMIIGLMLAAVISVSVTAQDATPAAGEAVETGSTTVSWAEGWAPEPESSREDQISLIWQDPATGAVGVMTYGELLDQTVDGVEDALDTFSVAYFSGAELEGITARDSGELESGAIWKVYDFSIDDGDRLTLVILVEEIETDVYAVSTVTGYADTFALTVERAQQDVFLDDEPVFLEGLDGNALVSEIATPIATPEATPAA